MPRNRVFLRSGGLPWQILFLAASGQARLSFPQEFFLRNVTLHPGLRTGVSTHKADDLARGPRLFERSENMWGGFRRAKFVGRSFFCYDVDS